MAGDHKCPVCQATFTRPQHVARHMRSHTGDRPYKCQHCGDQFARSDLLSRHINKCHASEKPPTTNAPNQRRKGAAAACRATTSKQACDQCVLATLPCDGSNPCSKCVQRKTRCTYVKFHRQTAPSGPGHQMPRPDILDLGNPLNAYQLSAGLGPRYAQTGDDHHHSMIYSHDPMAELNGYSAGGQPFGFNPQLSYSHDPAMGAAAGSELDFQARYRQQADMLRRTGVLPPTNVNMTQDVTGMASNPYYSAEALGQQRFGIPAAPVSANVPASNAWAQVDAHKQVDALQALGHLDSRQAQYLHQNPQQLPAFSASNGSFPVGVYGHHRTSSVPDHGHRRDSLSGSEAGSSSSYNSNGGHMPFDLSNHREYAESSSSRPSTANSDMHHPAPSEVPQPFQSRPRSNSDAGMHHDGFSSAFGLMSLDDPNVLAGIASDAQPFFSTLSTNSLTTPTPAKEREMRDRANFGSLFGQSSAGAGAGAKPADNTAPLLTPRDMETRELRDFWKQYMRTPLTGGGPLGAPALSAAPALNTLTNAIDSGARPGMGKRGLSRVASLPSVRTPGINAGAGASSYVQMPQQQQQQQQAQGREMPPPQAQGRTYTGAADDLRSYEQAVLSRKAPMTLSLNPKRGRTISTSGGPTGQYAHAYAHGAGGSPDMLGQQPTNLSRPTSAAAVYGDSRPPSVPMPMSRSGAGSYDSSHQPPGLTDDADSPGTDSSGPIGSTYGVASAEPARPGFKRLASQTLAPAHAKRSLLSYDDAVFGDDDDDSDVVIGAGADTAYERVGGSESPAVLGNQPLPTAERFRRMSAPSHGQSGAMMQEAGY